MMFIYEHCRGLGGEATKEVKARCGQDQFIFDINQKYRFFEKRPTCSIRLRYMRGQGDFQLQNDIRLIRLQVNKL